METKFALAYGELYHRHWWWRAREEYLFQVLKNHLPDPSGERQILEIGCGGGWLFDRLGQLGDVQGVEPDQALVATAGPHADKIYNGPFDRDFKPEKSYSLILMLDVLEHIEDAESALAHAVELLEPDGVLLLTVPAFRWLWTTHDVLNHHFTRYDKGSFAAVAKAAGMRIDRCNYFFHWLTAAKLVIRCKEAILGGEPTVPTLPGRIPNGFFYSLSWVEQRLFGCCPLPLGTSLLVVGGRRT